MFRKAFAVCLFTLAVASGPAAAAPAPGVEADALFPEGCFPGDRRDGDVYQVIVDVFGGARPDVDPGFGPQTVRAIYPTACDAGNWEKRAIRRSPTLNLHGDVADGRCHDYDAWSEVNPFQERRFTLALHTFRPLRDLDGLIRHTAPAGAEPLAWSAGAPDAAGMRLLTLKRGGRELADIHDRWARLDDQGKPVAFLLCRKESRLYNEACEHHALFDRARMTMTWGRWHLPRLAEIEAIGRKMLRCALRGPLPKPLYDG